MTWVAVSGKSVASVQWIGEIKIWSHNERVTDVVNVRMSVPTTTKSA